MKRISKIVLIVTLSVSTTFTLFAQVDTTQQITANRSNAKNQYQKPYVILISADGFRYDYAEKYQANHLLKYAVEGVSANVMYPSFPSLTFPNHYALATGLYPSHSGLAANSFYDRNRKDFYGMSKKEKVKDGTWYGGTPLWVLAEKQQMLAASFYWVASEADIQKTPPTYFYNYNELIPIDRRIQTVKDWLQLPEDKRPHLITFYFSDVDHAGHDYGPDDPETAKSVKYIDEQVSNLVAAVNATGLPVNFIFVSDHGMTAVDREHPIATPTAIDKDQFTIVTSGSMINLYAKDSMATVPLYQKLKNEALDYQVYLKKDMPKNLHYGEKDDVFGRIGDIILLSNWPKVFSDRKPGIGYHGFDPYAVKDMGATFMAWGPAFKKGLKINAFENVEIYQMVAKILGLSVSEKIDGTDKTANLVLKK